MNRWKTGKFFNLISRNLYKSNLFENFLSIRKLVVKEIPMFSQIDLLPAKNKTNNRDISSIGINEKIEIRHLDYYFSNAIARASKTMSDCRNTMNNNKKNGTNN